MTRPILDYIRKCRLGCEKPIICYVLLLDKQVLIQLRMLKESKLVKLGR